MAKKTQPILWTFLAPCPDSQCLHSTDRADPLPCTLFRPGARRGQRHRSFFRPRFGAFVPRRCARPELHQTAPTPAAESDRRVRGTRAFAYVSSLVRPVACALEELACSL